MSKSRHHRRPKIHGGRSNFPKGNISRVPKEKHQWFHALFCYNGIAMTPSQIVAELNNVWLDPDYMVVLVKKEKPNEHPQYAHMGS